VTRPDGGRQLPEGKQVMNPYSITPSTAQVIKGETKLPREFIWAVVAICALPITLNLLGVDFGENGHEIDEDVFMGGSRAEKIDLLHHVLHGSFIHTLLEWSAFCTAVFTALLAFTHYRISRDVTTPIIGLALFTAGAMDAFHTLAADRLIEAVADNRDLIPFTWAICRIFNALIMIAGVGMFLVRTGEERMRVNAPFAQLERRVDKGFSFIILVSLIFGVIAYSIIHYSATSATLPNTTFPDSLITRPYDVVPLVLFVFAGLVVYPRFYRHAPSFFSHALIISAIPEVVTELHMAFGSTVLFDNHFNIAHFLKIIAYMVPFGGLTLDYIRTYREQELSNTELENTRRELTGKNAELTKTLEELERFNRRAVDKELRMVELKREINELSQKLGKEQPYDISFAQTLETGG